MIASPSAPAAFSHSASDLVADLGERGLHRRVGLVHRHAVLRERLVRLAARARATSPSRASRRRPPPRRAPSAGRLGSRCERALVHDHDVLRMERARVVVVLDELPGLGRSAGGRRGDHRLHRAGGERLRHLGHLDHGRARAEQLREARGLRAVGAELGALQVADGLQRLLACRCPGRARRPSRAAACRGPAASSRAPASAPGRT